jgi:aminotransferase
MEEKGGVIAGNAFGPSGEALCAACYATSMKDLSEA